MKTDFDIIDRMKDKDNDYWNNQVDDWFTHEFTTFHDVIASSLENTPQCLLALLIGRLLANIRRMRR